LKLPICSRPLAIKTSSFEASSSNIINEVIFMFQCNNLTMVLISPIGLPTYAPLVTKKGLSHCGGAWQNISKEKKENLNYEPNWKCQDSWASQFPWFKILWSADGEIEHVHCLISVLICGREILLWAKTNNVVKDEGRRIAKKNQPFLGLKKDQWYVNKRYNHLTNMSIYTSYKQ
jgi:hypothetical protein